MTNTQRLGTILLAVGSLIVLCVVLVWLTAPLIVPSPPATTAVYDPSFSPFSAPALSPFTPPTPSEVGDKPINEISAAEPFGNGALPDELASLPASTQWNDTSYSETKALSAYDRAWSNSSLRLSIPALSIDAPVVPVSLEAQQSGSRRPYQQWSVPNSYAAGWHDSSSRPGQVGNTVLNGHNNVYGAVFGNLVDLTLGELIILYEADRKFIYQVVHREFLPEQGEPLKARLWNARWIAPSDDTRLTIVTCWPNSSNSHRLVVVAQPLSPEPDF